MIESLGNLKVKYAAKLKQKKYRSETNQFLVEGEHLVDEAIKSGLVDYIFTTEEKVYEGVSSLKVSERVFKKLSDLNNSRGFIAVSNKKSNQNLSANILLLDGVQDPGNLGTLIRSAAAFGFKTIISENSVDYYNEKVIRGSQGAIFYTSLMEENIEEFIVNHQEYEYYGTNVLKGTNLKEVNFKKNKIAIILGNEGSGVRKEIQNLVNTNINIPMLETESLNVGIAGGILMYEAFEGRR
jgi:TrmH family RNA methyltransferase